MQHKVDFLIIGSGIAGLTYALKVARKGKVLILTKVNAEETNTKYAQGGIAGVLGGSDTLEDHIRDTLIAGAGLCDEKIVRLVVTEGPERIREIIGLGARFDKNPSGEFDLAREGGHRTHRVLHYKDATGNEIERTLLQRVMSHPNITLSTHYFAIDILTQHHLGQEVKRGMQGIKCFGVYALNLSSGNVETILSKITLLATGGAGQTYAATTNPVIATGDGVAMAYRAKANVRDMEFIQFHPTALYHPGESPSYLISEAVRGSGGKLVTRSGKDFMKLYDERGSLAPRDIVARAIDNEMKLNGDECVYLDCSSIRTENFRQHFPGIFEKCKSIGIDVPLERIPVVPAAHYLCGGILVDKNGRSSIGNLYAAGECACTGLHGANRLASNSLLEALVFAHHAAMDALQLIDSRVINTALPEWNSEGTLQQNEKILITSNLRELQNVMSNYVGIVRSNERLKRALDRLRILYGETEALYERTIVSPPICELRNLISVAYLIVKFAMSRKESVGLHYSTDYPVIAHNTTLHL